jgi:hypothetical protein
LKPVISRPVLNTIFVAAMVLVLIFTIPLPVIVSPTVQAVYDYINKVPDGSIVWVNACCEPAHWFDGAGFPVIAAVVNQLFEKHFKIVFGSVGATFISAPLFVQRLLDPANGVINLRGEVYGTDYVILPTVLGASGGAVVFYSDIWRSTPQDFFGTYLSALPLMANVQTADAFKLEIIWDYGSTGVQTDVAQLHGKYGTPMIIACADALAPGFYPYVASKQAVGMVYGASMGAQYEKLVVKPGQGLASLGQANVEIILFILLMVGANLSILKEKEITEGGKN